MKKQILTLTLSLCLFANMPAFAENTNINVEQITSDNNQGELLNDPELLNEDPNFEKSKKDIINDIINSVKSNNITTEDFNEKLKEIKNKANENISSYYNEINKSLNNITDNNKVKSEEIKNKIAQLKKDVNKEIADLNSSVEGKSVQENFKKISEEYINIMNDYKEEITNKIIEKESKIEEEKKLIMNKN